MYFKYLKYLLKHKYYVGRECFKIGLYYRGIIHDFSKFFPTEFIPYAKHFHGPTSYKDSAKRDKTGYYKPTNTGDPDFDLAWLYHKNRNRHHWQYWVIPEVEEKNKQVAMKIPKEYIKEMICDWLGAAQAQGKKRESVKNWWIENKNKMIYHPESLKEIESLIDLI